MNIEFTAHEARIIGCLMEKEVTKPEQYPLSRTPLSISGRSGQLDMSSSVGVRLSSRPNTLPSRMATSPST